MQNQQKDKELIKLAQTNNVYSLQNFHGMMRNIFLSIKIAKT